MRLDNIINTNNTYTIMYITETSRRQKAQQAIKGLNRRVKTMAIISAENPMAQDLGKEYNTKATEDLIRNLRVGNYRYYLTKGKYGNPENSVMIYNISLDDTIKLAYQYNQESVIFVDMTKDGEVSYQYWEGDDHNSPLKKQHEEHEIVDATNDEDLYTKVSRHFKFRIPFFESLEKFNKVVQKTSQFHDVDRLISESLNKKYVPKHQWYSRGHCYYDKKALGDVMNEAIANAFAKDDTNRLNIIALHDKKRRLTEAGINRIMSHGKDGFIIISADRSALESWDENPNCSLTQEYRAWLQDTQHEDSEESVGEFLKQRNNYARKELNDQIKQSGFSYSPVYGGYKDKGSDTASFEPSYIVYNHDRQGNAGDFDKLRQLAIQWCKEFKQESVYIQAPDEAPNYYDCDGNQCNASSSQQFKFNDLDQEYFTTTKRKKSNDRKQFTADINFESVNRALKSFLGEDMFRNAARGSNVERMRATQAGEVIFDSEDLKK